MCQRTQDLSTSPTVRLHRTTAAETGHQQTNTSTAGKIKIHLSFGSQQVHVEADTGMASKRTMTMTFISRKLPAVRIKKHYSIPQSHPPAVQVHSKKAEETGRVALLLIARVAMPTKVLFKMGGMCFGSHACVYVCACTCVCTRVCVGGSVPPTQAFHQGIQLIFKNTKPPSTGALINRGLIFKATRVEGHWPLGWQVLCRTLFCLLLAGWCPEKGRTLLRTHMESVISDQLG